MVGARFALASSLGLLGDERMEWSVGLDSLVKLASAGAGGVAVLVVFWVGYTLQQLPDSASKQKHVSLRWYMGLCGLIAICSFGTSIAASYWDAQTVRFQKQKLEQVKAELPQLREDLVRLAVIERQLPEVAAEAAMGDGAVPGSIELTPEAVRRDASLQRLDRLSQVLDQTQ